MNTTEYYRASIKLQEQAVDHLEWIKATLLVIGVGIGIIIGMLS